MPIVRTGLIGGTVNIGNADLEQAFGEVSVPTGTETVLATLTVSSGKLLRILGVYGEGVVDGIFRLYIDDVLFWQGRNAWTDRNVQAAMQYDVTEGLDVDIRVIHQNGVNQTFTGGFYGHQVDA